MNELEDFDYNSVFENILKGVISGFLIAYLLIFGLIPSSKYPDNILDVMDNPWIFVIILIINFYILYWDLTIGLLLFVSLIALMLDIIIFTEGELFKEDTNNDNDEIGNKTNDDKKIEENNLNAEWKRNQVEQKNTALDISYSNVLSQKQFADNNLTLYRRLLQAENTRLFNGESTLFIVNQRENTFFENAIKTLELDQKVQQVKIDQSALWVLNFLN
jgi:ABC-type multidrug transport system fused ATPase/permease subunit